MTSPNREVELKARVDDVGTARANIERAGAKLVFEGSLRDRLYDTVERTLTSRDLVLRLRSYGSETGVTAHLEWKGPTSRATGFKVRSELTTGVSDPDALATMLHELGYQIVRAIDREIAQYELAAADDSAAVMVRFEEYPRMDSLVEVEGADAQIERAIRLLKIPREHFTADRLSDFVRAYEKRTGLRAAISAAALESV
jgi:predicted adenylyl cyclase CyaB